MLAEIRLIPPVLRSTLDWGVMTLMSVIGLLALATDSVGVGLAASSGAGALLILAAALGVNLRRCRKCGLSQVLPGFAHTSLATAVVIAVSLIVLTGSLDGWSRDSLLALMTAAALGGGLGLLVPSRQLSWVGLGLVFWLILTDQDLHRLWTGAWSPVSALLLMAVSLVQWIKAGRSGPRPGREPGRQFFWTSGSFGRRPFRHGQLISPLSAAVPMLLGGPLYLAISVVGHDESLAAPLVAFHQSPLAGFVWLFSILGVVAVVLELQHNSRLALRNLATLPGWKRLHLFAHAEISCWRVCVWLLAVLCPTLAGVGLWADESAWSGLALLLGLWLVWATLMIPFGLWIATLQGTTERMILVGLVVISGLFLFAALEVSDDGPVSTPLGSGLLVLALVALAGWGRHQARMAWSQINLHREP